MYKTGIPNTTSHNLDQVEANCYQVGASFYYYNFIYRLYSHSLIVKYMTSVCITLYMYQQHS